MSRRAAASPARINAWERTSRLRRLSRHWASPDGPSLLCRSVVDKQGRGLVPRCHQLVCLTLMVRSLDAPFPPTVAHGQPHKIFYGMAKPSTVIFCGFAVFLLCYFFPVLTLEVKLCFMHNYWLPLTTLTYSSFVEFSMTYSSMLSFS